MRSIAILLCLSLFGLNAEAAMLHVHRDGGDTDHHHEGLAAHSHKSHVALAPTHTEVSAPDEDTTAIPVVLGKATTAHIYYSPAASQNVVGVETLASSHVPQFVVTSRAHGPPSGRSCSLRAPPVSHLL